MTGIPGCITIAPTREIPVSLGQMTHFRRGRQRTRHRPTKVRLFEFATRTIKSWLTSIVAFFIDLLGVIIYLKGMAFGAVSMIVAFFIDLLGVAFHDLCLVLDFRLP
jgi:hypothetical protein